MRHLDVGAVRLIGVLFEDERGPLALPAIVLPEIDHRLGARIGPDAQAALHDDLVAQGYPVVDLAPEGYQRARPRPAPPRSGLGLVLELLP